MTQPPRPDTARFQVLDVRGRVSRIFAAGLSALAVIATVLLVSGCQMNSPAQTMVSYQPADGINVTLGDIAVRNLVIVADSADGRGQMSGTVVNTGTSDGTVTFATASGGSAQVPVKGGVAVSLSDGPTPVVLSKAGAAPGSLVAVQVGTPSSGMEQVQVPVLLPQGYYATVTPGEGSTTGGTGGATPSSSSSSTSASQPSGPTASN